MASNNPNKQKKGPKNKLSQYDYQIETHQDEIQAKLSQTYIEYLRKKDITKKTIDYPRDFLEYIKNEGGGNNVLGVHQLNAKQWDELKKFTIGIDEINNYLPFAEREIENILINTFKRIYPQTAGLNSFDLHTFISEMAMLPHCDELRITNEQIIQTGLKEGYIRHSHLTFMPASGNIRLSDQERELLSTVLMPEMVATFVEEKNHIVHEMGNLMQSIQLGTFGDIFKNHYISDTELEHKYPTIISEIQSCNNDHECESKIKMKAYAQYLIDDPATHEFGLVVKKLSENKRNFNQPGLLTEQDQGVLLKEFVQQKFSGHYFENMAQIVGIEKDELKTFISDLFDPSKKEITISLPDGREQKLTFTMKGYVGTEIGDLSPDDLRNIEALPIKLSLGAQNEYFVKEFFNYRMINFNNTKIYPSCRVSLTNKTGTTIEGYLIEEGNNIIISDIPSTDPISKRKRLDSIPKKDMKNWKISVIDKKFDLTKNDINGLIMTHIIGHHAKNNPLTDQEKMEMYDERKKKQQENQKITEETKKISELIDQLDDEDMEKEKEELEANNFDELRKNIQGDDQPFEEGATLYASTGPGKLSIGEEKVSLGGSERLQAKITNIRKNTNGQIETFDMIIKGITGSTFSGEHKIENIPYNAKDFNDIFLRKIGKSSVYKFKKLNKKTLSDLVVSGNYEINEDKVKNGIKDLKLIDWQTMEVAKGEKIYGFVSEREFIGLDPKENKQKIMKKLLMMKTNFHQDSVDISIGNNRKKTMNYTEFMLFMSDRGYKPVSENQYKEYQKGFELDEKKPDPLKDQGGLRRTSLGAIRKFFKNVSGNLQEYIKKKIGEQESDLNDEMVRRKVLLRFKDLPFIGTAFEELHGEAMTKIGEGRTKKINEYKSELTVDAVDGRRAGELIEEYFKSEGSNATPLKTAGYLLYALENGGGIYFRALSKRMGKFERGKRLLGEKYEKEFNIYLKKAILDAKLGRAIGKPMNNDELIDIECKAEINFIKKILDGNREPMTNIFGFKFRGMLEGAYNGMFGQDKINKAFGDEELHGSFNTSYENFKTHLGQMRVQGALGIWKHMGIKTDSYEEYMKRTRATMGGLLTGGLKFGTNIENKNYFKTICRTYGFTAGLYIDEPNGLKNLAKLIDIASEIAGLPADQQFSKATGRKESWIQEDTFAPKMGDNFDSIERWRATHGEKIMNVLNYQNIGSGNTLITHETLNKTERKIIDEYNEKNLEKENKSTDKSLDQKVFFEQGIRNLQPSIAEDVMLRYGGTNTNFNKELRNQLNKNFSHFKTTSQKPFEFVMMKLKSRFFEKKFNDSNRETLLYCLGEMKKFGSSKNLEFAMKQPFYIGNQIPSHVEEAIKSLVAMIQNNKDLLDDNLITKVFGKKYIDLFNYRHKYQYIKEKNTQITRDKKRLEGAVQFDSGSYFANAA